MKFYLTIKMQLSERMLKSVVHKNLDFLHPNQKFKDVKERQWDDDQLLFGNYRGAPVMVLPAWKAQLHALFVKTQLVHALASTRAQIGSVEVDIDPEVVMPVLGIQGTWVSQDSIRFREEQHRREGRVELQEMWDASSQSWVEDTEELQISLVQFRRVRGAAQEQSQGVRRSARLTAKTA
jgi:hypothetical protein